MQNRPIIIGVTGGSGGGKTSVSRAILANFPNEKIAMIEHDSYYKDQSHLTFEERIKTNYDHPFAFDTDLMIAQINELLEGRPVDISNLWLCGAYAQQQDLSSGNHKDVFIVEGILVLEDKRLRDLMDIKIFVDTDDDVRIIRRIKRDMEERGRSLDSVIEQYLGVVKTDVPPVHRANQALCGRDHSWGRNQYGCDWLDHNQDWKNPQRKRVRENKIGGKRAIDLQSYNNSWNYGMSQ